MNKKLLQIGLLILFGGIGLILGFVLGDIALFHAQHVDKDAFMKFRVFFPLVGAITGLFTAIVINPQMSQKPKKG